MKTGRFLLGIFFLAGPNISIYDLFPDIIGYLLIASSLRKMAIISSGVDLARDGLKKLNIIAVSKILADLLLFYLSASSAGTFDRGWHLTFSFAFAIIELIYTLPAFSTLLEGLDSAWMRHGSGKGDKLYQNTLWLTRFFIVAKNGLCVAAELPFLMESTAVGSTYDLEYVTAQSMRTVLSLFNVVVVSVLGLVWLFQMRAYTRRFKYASFQESAQSEYLRIMKDKPSLPIRARLRTVFTLLKAGSVFTLSFTVWNINLLPSFLFGLFGFCAVRLLGEKIRETDGVRVLETKGSHKLFPLLFTVCSFTQYLLTCVFLGLYQAGDGSLSYADIISVVIAREQTAMILFVLIIVFTALEGITFVLFVNSLKNVMCETAKIYTATKYEREQMRGRNQEVYNNIKGAYTWAFAGAVLLAFCCMLQQALIFTASIMWFVSMLASVLFIVLFIRATEMLEKEAESRFLYE